MLIILCVYQKIVVVKKFRNRIEIQSENKYMSNGYMKKSISWYQLYKRIRKQTLHKTRNTKVQVLINGELKECALVFTKNGSDFHLEPVKTVK